MRPVVYVETSVVSYYTARLSRDIIVLAQEEITRQWWPHAKEQFELVVSDVVVNQIMQNRRKVRDEQLRTIEGLHRLPLLPKCEELAKVYLSRLPSPTRSLEDALHLAIACVHGVDYLVSWNCGCIGNVFDLPRIAKINRRRHLYYMPIVCTPKVLPVKRMRKDPIVEEVRRAGQKLFEEAGGTMKGFFEMLRREEAKDKRPIFRRRTPPAPKKESK
jgi:predicted nucleic acid-binding protein